MVANISITNDFGCQRIVALARKLTKVTTPDHDTGNHKIRYGPKPEFTNELLQLRDSVTDMDTRLQSGIAERDQARAEFNKFKGSTSSLEKENERLRSELRTTGLMLSREIASHGQDGPIPGIHGEHNELHGLQRAIAANKRESSTSTRMERP